MLKITLRTSQKRQEEQYASIPSCDTAPEAKISLYTRSYAQSLLVQSVTNSAQTERDTAAFIRLAVIESRPGT